MNSKASEQIAVGGVIDPDANTAAAYVSDYLDMRKFNKGLAIVMAGTLGTGATLDAKLVQATDAAGTGKKDISGKSITQLTQAGSDDDKQSLINVDAQDLDVENGFCFVAIEMTVGTDTSDSGAVLLGLEPRYAPASDNDLASVDQIV